MSIGQNNSDQPPGRKQAEEQPQPPVAAADERTTPELPEFEIGNRQQGARNLHDLHKHRAPFKLGPYLRLEGIEDLWKGHYPSGGILLLPDSSEAKKVVRVDL